MKTAKETKQKEVKQNVKSFLKKPVEFIKAYYHPFLFVGASFLILLMEEISSNYMFNMNGRVRGWIESKKDRLGSD